MNQITNTNFRIVISYVIPGLILLAGLAGAFPGLYGLLVADDGPLLSGLHTRLFSRSVQA